MTISELIEALEAIRAEHGDLPAMVLDDGFTRQPRPDFGESCTPSLTAKEYPCATI